MDHYDENDDVWEVLGRVKSAPASPYFVRKVLRQVRETRQAPSVLRLWLRWLTPLTAAAVLAVGVTTWQWRERERSEFNVCFDTAADLESLVAFEEGSSWADLN